MITQVHKGHPPQPFALVFLHLFSLLSTSLHFPSHFSLRFSLRFLLSSSSSLPREHLVSAALLASFLLSFASLLFSFFLTITDTWSVSHPFLPSANCITDFQQTSRLSSNVSLSFLFPCLHCCRASAPAQYQETMERQTAKAHQWTIFLMRAFGYLDAQIPTPNSPILEHQRLSAIKSGA